MSGCICLRKETTALEESESEVSNSKFGATPQWRRGARKETVVHHGMLLMGTVEFYETS